MKKYVEINGVKNLDQAVKIINNNYPKYLISDKDRSKNKKSFYFHLRYEGDNFSSVFIVFDTEENCLRIRKDNGNKIRRYRKLFAPIIY